MNEELIAALIEVETWWLEDGMHNFAYGAPHCIFAIRELLDKYALHDERRIATGKKDISIQGRPCGHM